MAGVRKTFLKDISDKAQQAFGDENIKSINDQGLDSPLWSKWKAVWWATASQMVADLKAEGLVKSAESLELTLRSLDFKKEYFKEPVNG